MHIEATNGSLTVEMTRFGVKEAERLHECLLALAPVSRLVLDFRHVADLQDAAILSLAELVDELHCKKLELRGVTLHQARLLQYLREPANLVRDLEPRDPRH